MRTERAEPRAHIIVDDFFEPAALETIFRELPSVERRMLPGLVRDIGHDGQSVFFAHPRRQNKAVWIHEPSKTLRLFREQLWSEPMVQSFEGAREPLFQIIPSCWAPHLQVSSYMTGDHYDFHEDEGAGVNLTAIVFLAREPKKVRGGDLVLAYEGEEATIRFRHNRLLIFPSKTLHRVTPVEVASDDPRHARISLQCWLTHGRPATKPKRRAPEADRPTFLLAEEPIVAAAQAMIASSKAPDQTPEDLYWGAFYLSRILTSNLQCLVDAQPGLTIGPIRIRTRGQIEVHGRGRLGKLPIRVGFLLQGPEVPLEAALSLFVETPAGTKQRILPLGASERQATSLLRRLLGARLVPAKTTR
jgi:hypothetical protein